jgi:hypothetical protein
VAEAFLETAAESGHRVVPDVAAGLEEELG